jgi:glycolate oxidase
VAEICRLQGAQRLEVAQDAAQRDRIWEARRIALSALAKLKPTTVLEDATVPRSQIPAMIAALNQIARDYRLTIGTFGHAGDGNLHPTICCDRRDADEWHRVELAVEDIFAKALELGGTLSGEHGIGLAKSRFLEQETSRASVEWSRRLKKALDPKGILNPGKILGV